MTRLPACCLLAAALAALPVSARTPATRIEADNAIRAALAAAGDNPTLQAEALLRLAWPEGERDPAIGARARQEIVSFGANGVPVLSGAVGKVATRYRADVVAALIETRQYFTGPFPPEYLPGIETALWFGTREAKLLALDEVARLRDTMAVLSIMDSAVEDPEVLPKAIETLGALGEDRARFFLAEKLNRGTPEIRERAAVALARIGGRALEPLKAAMRSESRELRELAVRAILPAASEDDLGDLYDYVTDHPGDDPDLLTAVRNSAQELERLLEMKRQAEAADTPHDF